MSEAVEAKPSIEDLAAHDWRELLPAFRKKIEELSNRQLKRVVTALIEHPLEPCAMRFPYVQEKELYDLGAKLLDCKFVIMKAVLELKKEEINKLLEETAGVPENTEGEKKDETVQG